MDSESNPAAAPQASITPSFQQPVHSLIAPVWHTLVIVALILLNSYAGRSLQQTAPGNAQGRFMAYGGTFIAELLLVLFIWFGISRRGVKMRELVGGRWTSPEDFLIDAGIAGAFWLVSTGLRAALGVALGLINIHDPKSQVEQMKQAVGPLIPRSSSELVVFLALVVFAGIFEEIIFRGYLQRQFAGLARNIWIGILGSAVMFGAAHGYQGVRFMVLIGIWGAMFGVLAMMRKSLRPGMIAHAGQDALSGILLRELF